MLPCVDTDRAMNWPSAHGVKPNITVSDNNYEFEQPRKPNTVEFPYSGIHRTGQGGTRLSNILNYKAVPILMLVVTDNFLLLLPNLGCTSNWRSIPFPIPS
jgi:hypothetical protein